MSERKELVDTAEKILKNLKKDLIRHKDTLRALLNTDYDDIASDLIEEIDLMIEYIDAVMEEIKKEERVEEED